MSLGLLGAYNSDSDNSNSEDDNRTTSETTVKNETLKNPFIGSDNESSEEELVNDDKIELKTDNGIKEILSNPFTNPGLISAQNWLPKPSFMQQTEEISGLKYDNSVFSNPFRAKEDQKEAILTHHIGVTQKPETGTMFNGKKVCYNFRKGRCRHGHKCKFAHDNDVSKSVSDNLYSVKYDEAAQISNEKQNTDTIPKIQMGSTEELNLTEEASVVSISSGKKKRPGLTDGLVPSKKAMKFHNKVYN